MDKTHLQQFNFVVMVNAPSLEQAAEVMAQRLGHDEDYNFQYNLDWAYADWLEFDDAHVLNDDSDPHAVEQDWGDKQDKGNKQDGEM